jgi:DNA (cytosine-5)-methyltransferase 1
MDKVTLEKASQLLEIPLSQLRTWEKKKLIQGEKQSNHLRLFNLKLLQKVKNDLQGNQKDIGFKVLQNTDISPFTVIELFAGCGGMALGLENAGLKGKLFVEKDQDCINTLSLNRQNWNIIQEDIAHLDFKPYQDKIDIISGGFPCQAFSYAGLGKGLEDTRGTLFFEFARCVSEINPKIAIAENVRGLLSHDKGRTFELMITVLEQLGYTVTYQVLKAQFLDVPQKRERLIIMAIRNDLDIVPLFPKNQNYTISLREALKNCPQSLGVTYNNRKQEVMKLVPQGGNWRDLPLEMQKSYMKNSFYKGGGRTGFAKRLSWDEPCLTITCSPSQNQTERCHPDETRPLTIREYARVQSFPDDWQFTGSITAQYKQIGNAVPVNMAYHLGRCLIAMLNNQIDELTMIQLEKPKTEDVYQLSIPGLNL